MKIKAKLGAYSSIVGQPILLLGEGGRAEAQITLLHHGDMFRDRAKQIELLNIIVNAINAAGDPRPINCRFRLQETGQPYPRSGCNACGKSITTGLGNQCSIVESSVMPTQNPKIIPGQIACPCTEWQQDDSCPEGYPSLTCHTCGGVGTTTLDKIMALAVEMQEIAQQVGEQDDPFAAWEVIGHLQSTAMVAAEEVKVEGEPEVDPIKEAFCAGWITNASHESGDYLTGCMEGDYRDWQKDPIGYFTDAWKTALEGGAAEEDGMVSTDVPHPPKTNEDVMNALGAATIKADKIDLDNSASGIQLLIAAEREACAKLLEDRAAQVRRSDLDGPRVYKETLLAGAKMIRERGETVPAEQGEN